MKIRTFLIGSFAALGLMAASAAAYAAPPDPASLLMSPYFDTHIGGISIGGMPIVDLGGYTLGDPAVNGDTLKAPTAVGYVCDDPLGDSGGTMLVDSGGHLSMAMLGDFGCGGSGLDPSKALAVGHQAPA